MADQKKIRNIIVLFASLIVVGTIGYAILLRTNIIDALYMTVITISTVGYKEVAAMSPEAKIFSIFIIFWGVGTVGYTFSTLIVMVVEGEFKELWRHRMVEKSIANIKDHYIICGAGSTGEVIVKQFKQDNLPFIIIEKDPQRCRYFIDKDNLVIEGDATDGTVLSEAKVEEAKGMITVLPTDAENIMTVLSARSINATMPIISKAVDRTAPKKLKQVGANNTISINEIGGRRMAALMTHPQVIAFLDVITRVGDMELDLEDVPIPTSSPLVGSMLRDAKIPQRTGLIVLAVRKKGIKHMQFNPGSDYLIDAEDTLIVMGAMEQIEALRQMVKG